MRECSKSLPRRLHDSNFIRKYFKGQGIDIGGRPDPLSLYLELFPLCTGIKIWDLEDGDAQFMQSVQDNTYDFVHSSHCLEHLVNPFEGLQNWVRITKPDGHLIITIPDEDLYEQRTFPSTFNKDHKNTFTIFKAESWSPKSITIFELFRPLGNQIEVIKIEQINATYRHQLPRYDQTSTPITESAIEFILRKRSPEEIKAKGRMSSSEQPSPSMRPYYNQYTVDYANLKNLNKSHPPFTNTQEL